MKTAVIIPARMEARRLPGKPLELLGGKPLVVRVYEQAKKVSGVDEVVIATDSDEIFRAVEAAGAKSVMTRADHESGSDRVAEAAQIIGADWVINLQGDEPFTVPEDITKLVSFLKTVPDAIVTMDFALDSAKQWRDPNVVKVVKSAEGRAMYFSRAPIPYSRDGEASLRLARGHMGIYGYHLDVLMKMTQAPSGDLERAERLEQLRAMAIGIPVWVVDASGKPMGIDTPQDLEMARRRFEELGSAVFPG
jgi:3-deoxy-manno-octulosonate cytidylyltransferase (CMP-KDO synthetase)